MKSFTKIAMASLLGVAVLSTTAYADVAKGQKLYTKKMKKLCKTSGAKFAATHTQSEWESAKEDGTLTEMLTGSCPAGADLFKSEKFKKKYESHIYDFAYEYASDSGNVPSC